MRTASSTFCLFLLVAAVAVPYRFNFVAGPFTTVSILDMALIVSTIYLCARYLLLLPFYVGPRVLSISVLAPVVVAILSIAWAENTALSGASAIKYVYTALCYFVAVQFGRGWSRTTLTRLLSVVLISWLAGSIAMYLAVPGFDFFVAESTRFTQSEILDLIASMYTRLAHPYLGQSNDYAPLLAFLGFILLGYARLHRSMSAGVFAGLSFVSSALTFSRGVIAAILLGLVVYAICVRASISRLAVAGITVSLGVILVSFSLKDITVELADRQFDLASTVESRFGMDSIDERLESYEDALVLVREKPFLGYGVGFYDASGRLVSVHNAYLEQWRYFGIVLGTVTSICYLLPLVYFFGLRARAPHTAAWSDAVACGWLVLVVSSSVETFFEASVPRAVIYLLLGLCVGMTAELLRSRSRTVQTIIRSGATS